MGKCCLRASSFIFDQIIIKVASSQDQRKSSSEFDFGPDQTTNFELLALEWRKFYTFELEYLWGQLANLYQILCVASLGLGKGCIWDESFIIRWGGRLYSGGGGRNFFWWCTGGGENKNPLGQGGSYISSGIWGASYVFHWFLLSLKVKASGRPSPPDPPYPKWYCQQYQIFKIKKGCKIN